MKRVFVFIVLLAVAVFASSDRLSLSLELPVVLFSDDLEEVSADIEGLKVVVLKAVNETSQSRHPAKASVAYLRHRKAEPNTLYAVSGMKRVEVGWCGFGASTRLI